jgi:hypothetical protein
MPGTWGQQDSRTEEGAARGKERQEADLGLSQHRQLIVPSLEHAVHASVQLPAP